MRALNFRLPGAALLRPVVLLGLAAVAGIASSAAPVNCAPPAAALVSWYAAEGDASDSRGLNNGTLVGAGFAPGLVGQAFSLNGAGQYVSVADSPSLRPASVTVEAWVNPSALPGIGHIMAKQVGGGSCDSYVVWMTSGQLHGAVCNSSGGVTQLDGPALPASTWSHVALTYDQASRTTTLYVNGQQVQINTSSISAIGYDGSPLLFGADNQGGGITDFYPGLIDEPTLYDRALGGGEIQAIYQAGASGKCQTQTCVAAPPGARAWYKADGSTADFQGAHGGSLPNGGSYVAGKVGQALSLSGNQYMQVTDNPALDGPSYSVGGWFRVDAAGSVECFVCKAVGSGTSDSYALYYNAGTLRIAASTATSDNNISTGYNPAVGEWFYFAETYDAATQTATAYVNGTARGTINTAVDFDSHPLTLGADSENGQFQYFLNGAADDVQIYNRALSATEIAAIYRAGSNGQCAACVPLGVTPAAYLKGEGDASDSSGKGNNGTLVGGAGFAPGMVGQAFNLSGNLQYVNLGDSPSLRPSSITLDAWVNLNAISFTTAHVVARQVNAGVLNSYVLYTVNGQLNAFVSDAANNQTTISGPTLALNTWYHVAFSYDQATRQQVLYVNGQQVAANTSVVSAIGYDSSPTLIGADNEGSGITDYWDGQLDEVRIFPSALSGAQIYGLYCAGARGSCTASVTANKTSMSFGNLAVGSTSAAQTVYLSNHGSDPISVSTPAISGAGFAISANTCGATLNGSNTACSVSVTFAPTATGGASGSLSFSDGPDNLSPHIVTLSGNGVPQATVSPGSLAFGNVAVGGTSAAQAVYLSNHQSGPMSLSAPSISGAGFAISATTCGASLSGSNSACSVSVTFTPTGTGAVSGTLTLSGSPDDQSPHVIALGGNGVPAVTVTASSLAFGSVAVGHSSAAQTVYLSNHSNAPVSLGTPSISGSGFSISGTTCGATLNGSNTACAVSVTFTPTGSGPALGSLSLSASPDGQSPHLVSLSGTGH